MKSEIWGRPQKLNMWSIYIKRAHTDLVLFGLTFNDEMHALMEFQSSEVDEKQDTGLTSKTEYMIHLYQK